MKTVVNEKPAYCNFDEENPILGHFYQHVDGEIYVQAFLNTLICVGNARQGSSRIGNSWKPECGFDGDRDKFRRIEPVKFEFNVM